MLLLAKGGAREARAQEAQEEAGGASVPPASGELLPDLKTAPGAAGAGAPGAGAPGGGSSASSGSTAAPPAGDLFSRVAASEARRSPALRSTGSAVLGSSGVLSSSGSDDEEAAEAALLRHFSAAPQAPLPAMPPPASLPAVPATAGRPPGSLERNTTSTQLGTASMRQFLHRRSITPPPPSGHGPAANPAFFASLVQQLSDELLGNAAGAAGGAAGAAGAASGGTGGANARGFGGLDGLGGLGGLGASGLGAAPAGLAAGLPSVTGAGFEQPAFGGFADPPPAFAGGAGTPAVAGPGFAAETSASYRIPFDPLMGECSPRTFAGGPPAFTPRRPWGTAASGAASAAPGAGPGAGGGQPPLDRFATFEQSLFDGAAVADFFGPLGNPPPLLPSPRILTQSPRLSFASPLSRSAANFAGLGLSAGVGSACATPGFPAAGNVGRGSGQLMSDLAVGRRSDAGAGAAGGAAAGGAAASFGGVSAAPFGGVSAAPFGGVSAAPFGGAPAAGGGAASFGGAAGAPGAPGASGSGAGSAPPPLWQSQSMDCLPAETGRRAGPLSPVGDVQSLLTDWAFNFAAGGGVSFPGAAGAGVGTALADLASAAAAAGPAALEGLGAAVASAAASVAAAGGGEANEGAHRNAAGRASAASKGASNGAPNGASQASTAWGTQPDRGAASGAAAGAGAAATAASGGASAGGGASLPRFYESKPFETSYVSPRYLQLLPTLSGESLAPLHLLLPFSLPQGQIVVPARPGARAASGAKMVEYAPHHYQFSPEDASAGRLFSRLRGFSNQSPAWLALDIGYVGCREHQVPGVAERFIEFFTRALAAMGPLPPLRLRARGVRARADHGSGWFLYEAPLEPEEPADAVLLDRLVRLIEQFNRDVRATRLCQTAALKPFHNRQFAVVVLKQEGTGIRPKELAKLQECVVGNILLSELRLVRHKLPDRFGNALFDPDPRFPGSNVYGRPIAHTKQGQHARVVFAAAPMPPVFEAPPGSAIAPATPQPPAAAENAALPPRHQLADAL